MGLVVMYIFTMQESQLKGLYFVRKLKPTVPPDQVTRQILHQYTAPKQSIPGTDCGTLVTIKLTREKVHHNTQELHVHSFQVQAENVRLTD